MTLLGEAGRMERLEVVHAEGVAANELGETVIDAVVGVATKHVVLNARGQRVCETERIDVVHKSFLPWSSNEIRTTPASFPVVVTLPWMPMRRGRASLAFTRTNTLMSS